MRVFIKRLLHRRVGNYDNKATRILSYRVCAESFEDMYRTFVETFVEEQYFFSPSTDAPHIIDGGANIGLATLYFKWRFPRASVVAFEPHPHTAELLKKNIRENSLSSVEVVEAALSDREGSIILYGVRRAATIFEGNFGKKGKWNSEVVENESVVKTTKLSGYVKGRAPDLLKLDIEGAEGLVLKELAQAGTLRSVRKVVMEYHYRASEENKLSDILRLLEESGFMTAFFSDARSPEHLTTRDYTQLMIVATPRAQVRM